VRPQRPFRGTDLPVEAQYGPAYDALGGRIASDNITSHAIMPFVTQASTGGVASTAEVHIDWRLATLTASTGGAGSLAVTVSHSLGRTPIGAFFVIPADSRTNVALFVTNVTSWNSLTLEFGLNFGGGAGTATRSVVVF
jgi:hypothetical protein